MFQINQRTLILLVAFLFTNLANGQTTQFQQDMDWLVGHKQAGYAVQISQKGKVLFRQASGLANVEFDLAMKPNYRMEIGSITKQFTAVAIFKLAEQGRLKLDDPISKYISGISSLHGSATLMDLLSHTSGLVDPLNEPEFWRTRVQEPIKLNELIQNFKNGHWQSAPGARVQYSNVGYSFLAHVIEKVTAVSYYEYLQQAFFTPLNMTETQLFSFQITPNKASGYTYQGANLRHHDFLNLNWAYGAANLTSTVADLSLWFQGLMAGKVLSEEYLSKYLEKVRLGDGTRLNSGINFDVARFGKQDAYRISGSTMGYSSHAIYFPSSKLQVVVLSNSDGINGGDWLPPANLAAKLAATALALPVPDFTPVTITATELSKVVGRYESDDGVKRNISFEQGQLVYQREQGAKVSINPIGQQQFYFANDLSYIKFGAGEDGKGYMDLYQFPNNRLFRAWRVN